jgi:hypothetical protein
MNRRRGYMLIELVLVMLLLTFVAASVFLLTGAGSAAYVRMSDNRGSAADLRIALSYIDVRVKKIDGIGQITVRQAPFGTGQALVLSQNIEAVEYETYIYSEQGALRELFIEKGQPVSREMASEIATVDDMQIRFESDHLLSVTLKTIGASNDAQKGAPHLATQWIFLRTTGRAG